MNAFGPISRKHSVAAGMTLFAAGLSLASASLILAVMARSSILDVVLGHGDVSPTTQLDLAYFIGRVAAFVAPFGAFVAALALFLNWHNARSRLAAVAMLVLAAGLVMLRPALDEQLGAISRLSAGPFMLEIFAGLALLIITWPTRKAALATGSGLAFVGIGLVVAMSTVAHGAAASGGIVAVGLAFFAVAVLTHTFRAIEMSSPEPSYGRGESAVDT